MYTYDLYGAQYDITIKRSTYRDNGNTAVMAQTANGEPFATFTVNLGEKLKPEHAYLDTNNCKGVFDFMIKNGLATKTGIFKTSGFCTYPLVKLNLNAIEELGC